MVISHSRTLLLIWLAYSMGSTTCLAASLKEWAERSHRDLELNSGSPAIINRLLVISGFDKAGDPAIITLREEQSYFDLVQEAEYRFAELLNLKPTRRQARIRKNSRHRNFVMANADLMLVTPTKNAPWSLLRWEDTESSPTVLVKAPALGPVQTTLEGWLNQALNYQGVVLDQKNNFVLAGVFDKPLSGKRQALAIANSDKHWLIPPDSAQRKGAALLNLVKSEPPYALLKVVVAGKNIIQLPRGTKLIIEQ